MDSGNGPPSASSPSVPSPSRSARRTVTGSDTNDTDLGTTSPQKLANECWYQEVTKLKAKYDALQRTQRHLLGEDLGPLNVEELQNLEKKLEGALALARQRKTQIMIEQMEDLRIKERQLEDLNKQPQIKLEEEGQRLKTILGLWSSGAAAENSNFPLHPSHTKPMECDHEPVLQMGYHHCVQAEGSSVPKSMAGETNFIHGWGI